MLAYRSIDRGLVSFTFYNKRPLVLGITDSFLTYSWNLEDRWVEESAYVLDNYHVVSQMTVGLPLISLTLCPKLSFFFFSASFSAASCSSVFIAPADV